MRNPNVPSASSNVIERKKLMLSLRWRWELILFVLFGVSTALIMSSFRGSVMTLLLLIALPAVLLVPGIVAIVVRIGRTLLHGFTWWQGIWLFLFVSGLVFRDRSIQEIQGETLDGWALFRVGFVAAAGMILLLKIGLRQSSWPSYLFRGLVAWLATYSLVCAMSSLWSVFPSWTLYKSCEYLVDVAALAAVVASARSVEAYKRLFDWTWALLGLLMVSVWIGLAVRPQDALIPSIGIFGVQLAGVMPNVNSNTVGELGAVIGVIAICRLLRGNKENARRVWYGALLTFGLVTMCFAQARSGILGFLVGLVVVLLVSGRVAMGLALLASAVLIFIANRDAWEVLSDFMRRGESEQEIYSLSSRVEWWSIAWPAFLKHPLTGYGAFAGARFFVMAESGMDVTGIHSDWVETLVGTGLWGFIPALLALLGTWRELIRPVRFPAFAPLERELKVEAVGVLAVISVRSIFSSDLFWHPPIVFFAILGYAQFLIIRRKDGCHNKTIIHGRRIESLNQH
jgi:O-antigen ligase